MTDWRRLMIDTSARVQRLVGAVGAGDRTRTVGRGAAGDKTLVADKKAEDELIRSLTATGEASVLSEERGELSVDGARYLAILDPLDGSSNFSRGIPFYCTSICLVEGERLEDARYALVRDLVNGDVYFAERGKGATKNGRRISASTVSDPARAVVGVDISRSRPDQIAVLGPLLATVNRQAHLGANALELCMVAEGRLDGFVDVRGRMRITDFAAAYLIAKEAGAMATTKDGGELDPPLNLAARFDYVVAGRPLHRALVSMVGGHPR